LPGVSLTFAWRLDTSIACLGLRDRVITKFKETKNTSYQLFTYIHTFTKNKEEKTWRLLKNEIQDTWASASCRILS
jgi:hypothetical protein